MANRQAGWVGQELWTDVAILEICDGVATAGCLTPGLASCTITASWDHPKTGCANPRILSPLARIDRGKKSVCEEWPVQGRGLGSQGRQKSYGKERHRALLQRCAVLCCFLEKLLNLPVFPNSLPPCLCLGLL